MQVQNSYLSEAYAISSIFSGVLYLFQPKLGLFQSIYKNLYKTVNQNGEEFLVIHLSTILLVFGFSP